MAQVHEFNISNVALTGSTVPVPVRQFDIEIVWTDDEGNDQRYSGTHRWPNVLNAAPDGYMRRKALEMVQEIAYSSLGIALLPETAVRT
jgi:hypothetical protein